MIDDDGLHLREPLVRATAAPPAPPAGSAPAGPIEPDARPARSAAAPAVPGPLAAGPTLGLGMTIALVGIVTLVAAVMPLPRGGLRAGSPSGGPAFTQIDPAGDIGPSQISICKDGCQVETAH